MAERVLIVDSDVFILLAAAGVLERVAGLLGVKPENIRRLDALPYQLERGKRFKKYPDPVRKVVRAKCDVITPLTDRPANDDRFERLVQTEMIDEGEALLMALTAERPAYYLASGDKRSIEALAKGKNLGDVRVALKGRIICLEATLRLLVEADGVEKTASAFASVRDESNTLRVIFSEAAATDPKQCLEYIASYFEDLARKVGRELLYSP